MLVSGDTFSICVS